MSVEQQPASVYRVSPMRLWSVPAGIVVLALLLLGMTLPGAAGDPSFVSVVVPTVVVLLAVAAFVFFLVWYPRLVVSGEGVELHQMGYRLGSPWHNVESIYELPGHQRPGFVLREPLTGKAATRLYRAARLNASGSTRYRLFSNQRLELLSEGRLIPIDAWAYLLKRGTLQEHLASHAPWLLAE